MMTGRASAASEEYQRVCLPTGARFKVSQSVGDRAVDPEFVGRTGFVLSITAYAHHWPTR